jgi:hypothetical protein
MLAFQGFNAPVRPVQVSCVVSPVIELNSPSTQFEAVDWSATVGFTPPSPGWSPGATFSLLVAHSGKVFGNADRFYLPAEGGIQFRLRSFCVALGISPAQSLTRPIPACVNFTGVDLLFNLDRRMGSVLVGALILLDKKNRVAILKQPSPTSSLGDI